MRYFYYTKSSSLVRLNRTKPDEHRLKLVRCTEDDCSVARWRINWRWTSISLVHANRRTKAMHPSGDIPGVLKWTVTRRRWVIAIVVRWTDHTHIQDPREWSNHMSLPS